MKNDLNTLQKLEMQLIDDEIFKVGDIVYIIEGTRQLRKQLALLVKIDGEDCVLYHISPKCNGGYEIHLFNKSFVKMKKLTPVNKDLQDKIKKAIGDIDYYIQLNNSILGTPTPYVFTNNLENIIFPYTKKLQNIYEKICKIGKITLSLLEEIKQYAYDTRRNFVEVPCLVRIGYTEIVASTLLRRKACLSRKATYSVLYGSFEWNNRYQEQENDLIEYARLENIWYQSQEDFIRKYDLVLSDKQGTETKIYCDKNEEFVYKFLQLNSNCNFLYDCLLERIVIHNYMFGDKTPLEVVGFCSNKSSINVIVSQPQIDSEVFATDDQIKELRKTFKGFNPHNKYALKSDDIFVYDLHNKNVLIEDNECYIVDCYAKLYRKEDLQNKYINQLGNFKEADKIINKYFTTFHINDLITYKGFEETIFKIVDIKGNRYIVIDLADRTKTKNEIPMSDNDKLQIVNIDLLKKEMELEANNLGNVVEELQPSGLSGFEDEFSKELLVAEMHLLELEKLKDFGEKIGGSAKDRYNGRKSKDKTENGQKTKGFNRLPTMDEMQSFGQECFHTKFKPNVSDFEDFGLNKIVARLCFFHYYGIFDKYAGYNVNSINDLYSLVDDKRIQDTITSYFIENKRHTQNFKTQYFAPDTKVHFYAIDFVYTALSMNLEKDLKDDFDYKNVLKAYNRGNKDWHYYRDKCIFLDKNKNDITEENKQRVFNLAYENAMNDFPLFRVMLTYNNGIIFLAHKDCKENQRTWRPLSQKYAKDLQQDICSAGWQDIYKHYAELYVKGKELYGQQFGFDEPDKWRFKDKEGLFAKVREGKDWRNGRNAEPKDFIDTFGFRAVEFGETMPQKERWEHLNRTFDSFMDLCDILNIKPENISLGGTLALSFGSRGRGGKHAAAAHYEPTKKVINLTRRSGAGCLAHEWFHAFDNQVCDHSYAYGQSCYGTRDAYSGWITNQDVSHYFYLFSNYCSNINGFNFYKSAVALDYYEKRKEDYWQKKLECGARAFEWYVIKKLTDRQQINEYLAQIPLAEPDRMKLYPYPHPNDYDTIENIFDGIFKNVQQVKTETGVTIR